MNILIVFAHPNPKSFNGALLDAAKSQFLARGDQVQVLDLVAERFNPVLSLEDLQPGSVAQDVKNSQKWVDQADRLVFIYPVWWYDRPAILKGWMDRVLTQGFAFDSRPEGVQGLLSKKMAWVIQTTGTALEQLEAQGIVDLPHRTIQETLRYCGIDKTEITSFFSVGKSKPEDRQAMLTEVSQFAKRWATST